MIGERFGHVFDRPLEGLATRITVNPNTLTLIGFLVTVAASAVLVKDLFLGGILILAGAFFDILDGVVARANMKSTPFGAFLDSVLDRYSDAAMFLGLSVNLFMGGNNTGALLAVIVLSGAFLISYARARAEGLGWTCKVGLMERPERIVLLVFGAISGFIMPVLWLMAVLTHLTAVQRIYHVRHQAADRKG